MKLFVKGEPFDGGDYRGHRTVLDMVQFLKMAEEKRGQLEKDLGRAKESLILAQKMKSNPVVIKKHQQEVASLAGQIKVQDNKIQQIKMAR